jgi:2-hydroxy-3-keto-5-methylthiopentenyl-1-phosphate phosphatase
VRSILARAWMHRRLWLNDPDCLLARADAELDERETRTLAAAIAVTGGATVVSDDVPRLPAGRRALVRQTLEAARRMDGLGLPGAARALDLLEADLAGRVAGGNAEHTTFALINASDDTLASGFDPAKLGLAPLDGPPAPLLGTRPPTVDAAGRLELALEPHESAVMEAHRASPLAVFCDFDGTFSVQDVGATLGERHAQGRPAIWARFAAGEIDAWECNMAVLDGMALPRTRVEEFLETVELDPGARELVDWCESRGVPFRVLSDGFDANLNRLQEIHGVRFAYDANALRYQRGRWRIRPGFPNPACECGTGTCKRGRIEAFRSARPGTTLVHIGNGRVSDLCGAIAADLAFAKDSLAEELESRGVAFERFETLRDVIPQLEQLLPGATGA